MRHTLEEPRESIAQRAGLRLKRCPGDQHPPVVALEGEFDLDTVPCLDGFLRRHLGPFYHREHLVLDLAAATFVDSTFVGFVVTLLRRQQDCPATVVLAGPRGQVRRALGIVGLPNVVPVYETVEEALSALAAGHLPEIPPAFVPAHA